MVDTKKVKLGKWVNDGTIPPDMEVVIGRYEGYWPGRGTGAYADIYAYKGEWFNVPESVKITGWMFLRENCSLDAKRPMAISPFEYPLGEWVTDLTLPPEIHSVIVEYMGYWPGRGNGGITDLYAYAGTWFNIPEGVTVVQWKYDPDNVPATDEITE
jgi:hypothetical protein